MALSRSGSIMYLPFVLCMPTTMSLMIFSGSSDFGLSLDKIVRSLKRPAASPMTGRLARSFPPPQPNSVMIRPLGLGLRGVDEREERLATVDALEPPGNAL